MCSLLELSDVFRHFSGSGDEGVESAASIGIGGDICCCGRTEGARGRAPWRSCGNSYLWDFPEALAGWLNC